MKQNTQPHYKSVGNIASNSNLTSWATWILIAVASIVALTGAYFWGARNASVTELEILIPTPAPALVQVMGEVQAPGLYQLDPNHRVLDAIEAAGGMTANAAITNINLAATVRDGARILVPSILPSTMSSSNGITDAPITSTLDEAIPSSAGTTNAPSSGFPINLNSATVEQLKMLPGIGDTRASQIIAFRASVGEFSTLEQLLEIGGIGTKTLENIRPLVVLQ